MTEKIETLAQTALESANRIERDPRRFSLFQTVIGGGLALELLAGAGLGISHHHNEKVVRLEAAAATCAPDACSPPTTDMQIQAGDRRAPVRIKLPSTTLPPTTTTTAPVVETSTTPPPVAETTTAVPRLHIAAAQRSNPGPVFDISYPQCDKSDVAKMADDVVPPGNNTLIVGVNGGRPFTVNSCLGNEAAAASQLGLYVNSSFSCTSPNPQYVSPQCQDPSVHGDPHEFGKLVGLDAVNSARQQIAKLPLSWYVDVETANSWDHNNPAANVASIQGEIEGIRQGVAEAEHVDPRAVHIGIYSTGNMWRVITGSYQGDDSKTWPVWYATAQAAESPAVAYCDSKAHPEYNFTGGGIEAVQYMTQYNGDLDTNAYCPAAS